MSGKSKDVPVDSVEEWLTNLPSKIKEYQLKNIYSIDETGFFFHFMPTRTLSFKSNYCHSGNESKDCFSILL